MIGENGEKEEVRADGGLTALGQEGTRCPIELLIPSNFERRKKEF